MNNPIKATPEELAELIELCGLYSTAGDMTTADDVYTECIKQRAGRDYRWAHYCAVATILRVGYILGQRAERNRHTQGGLKLERCTVWNGGRQHE